MKKFLVCAIAMALISAPAMALIPNFEGFENPAWAPDTQGIPNQTTWDEGTRIVSGGDGLTSFNGSAHGRVAAGAASYHGGLITDAMAPWFEVAVYIDLENDFFPAATVSGFNINQTIMRNNGFQKNFNLMLTNGSGADPNQQWTAMVFDSQGGINRYLTSPGIRPDRWVVPGTGWYNLQMEFYEVVGAFGGSPLEEATVAKAHVYNAAGTLIHSFNQQGAWLSDPGQQTHMDISINNLTGPASLAIDDVQTYWVPEPASLSLLALGGLMLLRRRR
jgi:hypothetical protein